MRLRKFPRGCLLTGEAAFFGFLSLTGGYAYFSLRLVRVRGTSKVTLGTLAVHTVGRLSCLCLSIG